MDEQQNELKKLVGLTIKSVKKSNNEDFYDDGNGIVFTTECGRQFGMTHYQDCCETVYLENDLEEFDSIIGGTVLRATKETKAATDEEIEAALAEDYSMWTFYHIETTKGFVHLRWFGTSNGYYSVDVDFFEVERKN